MQGHQMLRLARAAGLAAAFLGPVAGASANDPPAVVFRTRPRAVDGVISGRGPLDVTFNMCPTSDADPGDQLKFTYDFDGDGAIDYYGHCRQTHRYPVSQSCPQATVCVTDRQPGHQVCRTYSVCSTGSKPDEEPPSPPPPPKVEPDILPGTYDLYSFTASPGTTVDVSVDTISPATAFDPWACISTTRDGCVLFDENVVDWGDDDQPCTFPPPNFECPSFSATLPADDDGVYYLLVSDGAEDDFAGDVGMYALQVSSDASIGTLTGVADNAPDDTVPASAVPSGGSPPAPPSAPRAPGRAPGAVPGRPAPGRPSAPAPPEAPAEDQAGHPSVAPAPVHTKDNRTGPASRPKAAPEPEAAPSTAIETAMGDAGPRIEAAFRTDPVASAAGRITGGASFDVTFDLCASRSGEAGKELSFRFDLDGDGATDASTSCRQTRRYEFEGAGAPCVKSVACVGDGEERHEACRTYTVCRSSAGAPK